MYLKLFGIFSGQFSDLVISKSLQKITKSYKTELLHA